MPHYMSSLSRIKNSYFAISHSIPRTELIYNVHNLQFGCLDPPTCLHTLEGSLFAKHCEHIRLKKHMWGPLGWTLARYVEATLDVIVVWAGGTIFAKCDKEAEEHILEILLTTHSKTPAS